MAIHVDPTAIVHPQAALDDEVRIGPYCVIDAGAFIGARTVLHSHVTLMGNVRIGADNEIYPYSCIGGEPQDLSYKGSPTWVVIGDRNVLREGITIHRATEKENGVTRIGSDCYIMAYCHFAHDVQVGSHVSMANSTMLCGHVHVHDYATLSGMIGVHHFASIGSYSFVGGMSRVSMDVPPFMIVEGHPASVVMVNQVGLKRRGFSMNDIRSLTTAHRLLYRDKVGVTVALQVLESQQLRTQPVELLFEFLHRQREGRRGRARERLRAA